MSLCYTDGIDPMSDNKPKTNQEVVILAIKKAGGVAALADAIGLRPQAVHQWKRIPTKRVLAVEKATGIKRQILRPDLYRQ